MRWASRVRLCYKQNDPKGARDTSLSLAPLRARAISTQEGIEDFRDQLRQEPKAREAT